MNYNAAIQSLVSAGAALSMKGGEPAEVAYWRSASERRHFWFQAGDTSHDGHPLACAGVEILYGGEAVAFRDGAGGLVAYLTSFDEAVDDPARRERMAKAVEDWRRRWENDQRLRALVIRETKIALG